MKDFISSKYFRCAYNDADKIKRRNMLENLLKRKYIPLGLEKFFKGIYYNSSKDIQNIIEKLLDRLENQKEFIGKLPRFVGFKTDWSAEPIWLDGASCDCGECLLLPKNLQKDIEKWLDIKVKCYFPGGWADFNGKFDTPQAKKIKEWCWKQYINLSRRIKLFVQYRFEICLGYGHKEDEKMLLFKLKNGALFDECNKIVSLNDLQKRFELDENIELEEFFMKWGKMLYERLDGGRYYKNKKNVDIDEFNKIGKKLKFKLQRYLPYNVVVEYENKARV